MATVVQFTRPGVVELAECAPMPLTAGAVRVRTLYSGISAGTELTAFRGTNPYLTRHWDAGRRLFTDGEPSFAYPVAGWGYSEVGEVVEAADGVTAPAVGDVVYGIWGHRSEAVLPAAAVAGSQVPAGAQPLHGVFARVGAIALNGVLAAGTALGDRVAIFGQGVIGLLATRLATLSGAEVLAVDAIAHRRCLATTMGAVHTIAADAPGGAGDAIRRLTGDAGVDSAIELSGSYRALHEAVRAVATDAVVVASGFYQGEASALRLGEEFHHNRVQIVASQIGAVPIGLSRRWDHSRLNSVVMAQIASGALDVRPLVTDVLPADQVADAFRVLDDGGAETLQVVLTFGEQP